MKRHSQGTYTHVIDPEYPMAGSRGRVLEHRHVMSEHLGRPLTDDEIVHHEDEDPKNNHIDNLTLMQRGEHTTKHNPPKVLDLVCPQCGVNFTRTERQVRGERAFCSRSCSTTFYKPSHTKPPPSHGTYGRYRKGCRCAECKDANRTRIRKYRSGR